jgi:antitoxin (DNA-binding transcriptional repressor) of toxin-antitoxin stability system
VVGIVRRIGVHEAKTHLSRLLRDVEAGEEIVLMRGNTAVARIVAEPATSSVADSYGMFSDQFEIAEDFDADSEELADLFGISRAPRA